MMGGETSWNMQSIDSNKEYCITLHVVGYIWRNNDSRSQEHQKTRSVFALRREPFCRHVASCVVPVLPSVPLRETNRNCCKDFHDICWKSVQQFQPSLCGTKIKTICKEIFLLLSKIFLVKLAICWSQNLERTTERNTNFTSPTLLCSILEDN